MDRGRDNVARMEPDRAQCRTDSHLRRGSIEVVMSGETGRSRFIGTGKHLLGSPHKASIAPYIDHQFGLEHFLDATIWLDDNIGSGNWCYDGMTYYFSDRDNLINFKLRYLFDA